MIFIATFFNDTLFRIYETCTREKSAYNNGTIDKEDFYWCPQPSDSDASTVLTSGKKGKCSTFIYPEDNGCPDHYDAVNSQILYSM